MTSQEMVLEDERLFFKTVDGKNLKSITELVEYLKKTDEKNVKYHLSHKRNDFAKWLKDVFKMDIVNARLQSAKNSEELLEILKDSDVKVQINNGDESLQPTIPKTTQEPAKELSAKEKRIQEMAQEVEQAFGGGIDSFALNDRFEGIKQKMSNLRKQDYDMWVPQLLSQNVQAKMQIAQATQERGDWQKVKILLDDLEKEIQEVIKADEKELLDGVKLGPQEKKQSIQLDS
ncbi:hypothetical protein GOV04_03330 [Candidatus Woesearchaeota archaeon]|nr:hypothetical protein [Candidatus Woesearchaeota archaeon]